jgi:hypothetical protein
MELDNNNNTNTKATLHNLAAIYADAGCKDTIKMSAPSTCTCRVPG